MHCPQCGQQQISDETRFCKSCGFSLVEVRGLLATAGIPRTLETESTKACQSARRKGVRHGAILLFVFMVSMPLNEIKGGHDLKFLPMMFLMAGMMRILYAVIFQEGAPGKGKQDNTQPYLSPITTSQLGTAPRGAALATQSIPVMDFNSRRVNTAEMVSPPSVTENTTKLLSELPASN